MIHFDWNQHNSFSFASYKSLDKTTIQGFMVHFIHQQDILHSIRFQQETHFVIDDKAVAHHRIHW